MQATLRRLLLYFVCFSACVNFAVGQAVSKASSAQKKAPLATPSADLSKQPTLYAVGYAHLDTQWRWEYPQTIQEYLSKTMRNNFALFEKYPHYIFNFTGANRYRRKER